MISVPIYLLAIEGTVLHAITPTTTIQFECDTAFRNNLAVSQLLQDIISTGHVVFWDARQNRLLLNEELDDTLLIYDEVVLDV